MDGISKINLNAINNNTVNPNHEFAKFKYDFKWVWLKKLSTFETFIGDRLLYSAYLIEIWAKFEQISMCII